MGKAATRLFTGALALLSLAALVAMDSSPGPAPSAGEPLEPSLPGVTLARDGDFLRGISLPLYYREPHRTYGEPLREIATIGADAVSLVVTWSQETIRATEIAPDSDESRADEIVIAAIQTAHDLGLRVFLLPILRIEQREPGEWRGTLRPTDVDAWFESYERYLTHYAEIAEAHSVEMLAVGSELASMEAYESHWRALIGRLREVYSGELIYSANWDHYHLTPFWDALDRVGLSGYWELTDSRDEPVVLATLEKRWAPLRDDVLAFLKRHDMRLVFSEIGYYSQVGTAWHPWDYTRRDALDHEQQYLCYRAFYDVWRDVPELSGVFFWHWFGEGGVRDGSYNPRGKPAAEVIRHWYRQWPRPNRQAP